jgi:uracil-DNA glycosylase
MLQSLIQNDWIEILKEEFEKPYFKQLNDFVINEYQTQTCYPFKENIFAALNYVPLEKVKVVLLGQDPYHGPNQANGLAFSVYDGTPFPPSLQNIFKEIHQDLNIDIPLSGNLERWAKQGVLLLNATLTVAKNHAGSHQNKGWETFTDTIISSASKHKQNVVFLLWGNYARKKIKLIDAKKHLILESGHPSPMSANRGLWFGNKHFSQTNDFLISHHIEPIEW